jgi:hypothetical protein
VSKMPWSEVKQIADDFSHLSCGQKVRTNHNSVDCAGGSNSMIVERKDDNSVGIHCFRCGGRGWFGTGASVAGLKSRAASYKGGIKAQRGKFKLPRDCTKTQADWPAQARVFVRQAGLTDKEVADHEIMYSEEIGRVVIPVGLDRSGADTTVDSFQTRRVLLGDKLPKYLSYTNWPTSFYVPLAGETLVLTEDVLSAIRVSRHLPALALLGVKLQPHHIKLIHDEGFKKFIVWLDDDNGLVKQAQLRIQRQLSVFGQATVIHSDGVDPKEMDDATLKGVLL